MRTKGFLSGLLVICVAVIAGCCAMVCEKKSPETASARVKRKNPLGSG